MTSGARPVLPAIRISPTRPPGCVSVVIPTRNRHELLAACLESIAAVALRRQDSEVTLTTTSRPIPDTLAYLSSIDGREATVLRIPGDFHFACLNNAEATAASGRILCARSTTMSRRAITVGLRRCSAGCPMTMSAPRWRVAVVG